MDQVRVAHLLMAGALATTFCGTLGLAQDPSQRPQPRPAQGEGRVDLPAKVKSYTALLRDRGRFTAQNATQLLHRGYDEVLALRLETIDFGKVDRDPHGLTQSLMTLTLVLDERMAEFYAAGQLSETIGNAKRRALRAIRYLREAIVMRTAERAPDKLYTHGKPALAELYPKFHWSMHPQYQNATHAHLPRTFVLLCMGSSNVSATIARSANEDNTFSHLAIGYRSREIETVAGVTYPPNTLFIVESLIETGVIIQPFGEHYKGVDRDVIFIARDETKQGALDAAADAFFQRANTAIKSGKPLGYDFSMGANLGIKDALQGKQAPKGEAVGKRLPDPDAYFCAAIGHELFAKAGMELFPVRTKFNQGANSKAVFRSWGIEAEGAVQAPGDADVSGVLLRVGEAAKLEALEANHVRQAVLRQMFRWMDEENYVLRWPLWVSIATAVAGGLNDTFLDIGKVPSGMNKDILRSFTALDKTATLYNDALVKANAAFRQKHKRAMVPYELVEHLEGIRDKVEGTDRWFRKIPWAKGRYAIELRWGKKSIVEFTQTKDGFKVLRRVFDKKGKLVETVEGTATQDEKSLSARFRRNTRQTPRRLRYRLEFNGKIRVSAKEGVNGRDRGGSPNHYRRIGKGKKVSGPTHK